MQFPNDWFIYVIPGSLFLSLFFLCDKCRDKSLQFIKENGIIAIPIIIILSFLIGFAENVAFSKIRSYESFRTVVITISPSSSELPPNHKQRMLINQHSNQSQLEEYISNYRDMIFIRLTFLPLFILAPFWIFKIIKLRRFNRPKWKNVLSNVLIFLIIVWIPFTFYLQWKEGKQRFIETERIIVDNVRTQVGDSVWNSNCNGGIK
jgi:hypothetical protein